VVGGKLAGFQASSSATSHLKLRQVLSSPFPTRHFFSPYASASSLCPLLLTPIAVLVISPMCSLVSFQMLAALSGVRPAPRLLTIGDRRVPSSFGFPVHLIQLLPLYPSIIKAFCSASALMGYVSMLFVGPSVDVILVFNDVRRRSCGIKILAIAEFYRNNNPPRPLVHTALQVYTQNAHLLYTC
jgi:hypothetical protein